MWWIMIGTVAAVHASVRRSVAPKRPGVGASSRRRNSTREKSMARSGGRGLGPFMASARCPRATHIADAHDGRGAEPKGLVGILDLDPHGEPRGEAHPVDRLLDARQSHH